MAEDGPSFRVTWVEGQVGAMTGETFVWTLAGFDPSDDDDDDMLVSSLASSSWCGKYSLVLL